MRRAYDYQGFSSSIIEACDHCGRFVSGDDLEEERYGHKRCPTCRQGTCANCRSDEAAEGSNLCEECLTRHGLEALWGLLTSSQALRLQVRGKLTPILGFIQEVTLWQHVLHILVTCPCDDDDEEGRMAVEESWIQVDAVERVEACGAFEGITSGHPSERERRRLFAWISREEVAEALGRSLSQSDDDDDIFADDDDYDDDYEDDDEIVPAHGTEEGSSRPVGPDGVPADTQALLDALGVGGGVGDERPEGMPRDDVGTKADVMSSTLKEMDGELQVVLEALQRQRAYDDMSALLRISMRADSEVRSLLESVAEGQDDEALRETLGLRVLAVRAEARVMDLRRSLDELMRDDIFEAVEGPR